VTEEKAAQEQLDFCNRRIELLTRQGSEQPWPHGYKESRKELAMWLQENYMQRDITENRKCPSCGASCRGLNWVGCDYGASYGSECEPHNPPVENPGMGCGAWREWLIRKAEDNGRGDERDLAAELVDADDQGNEDGVEDRRREIAGLMELHPDQLDPWNR